jgi:hypothetical protein
MAEAVGALRVSLGLDSAAFEQDLGKVQRQLGQLSSEMNKSFLAIGAAVAAATVAIGAAIKNVIDEADDMNKLSAKLGVPIEQLSQLAYAADLAGVPMEDLSTALKKLSTAMSDAQSGGQFSKLFKAMGISVTDAKGQLKSSTAVMLEVSNKFDGMKNGAQKAALAVKYFGKAGLDMIPLLNDGAGSIREMMKEADALGLTLDGRTGDAAEQFNDNLSRLGSAVKGLAVQLTVALAPALAAISDAVVVMAKGMVAGIGVIREYSDVIAVAAGALAVMFSPAILAAVGSLTLAIGGGLLSAIAALDAAMLANPIGVLAVGIAAAITAIYVFRDEIKQAIGIDVVGITKDAVNFIINAFHGMLINIKFIWTQFPNIIGAAVIGASNAVISTLKEMVNRALQIINDMSASANKALSTIGLNIPPIKLIDDKTGLLENRFIENLKNASEERKKAMGEIQKQDPLGYLGGVLQSAYNSTRKPPGPPSADLKLPASGGGGSKKDKDPFEQTVQKAKEKIALLQKEREAIGLTEEAASRMRLEQELINQATDKNHQVTAKQLPILKDYAAQMSALEAATRKAREALDFAKDATKGFLQDLRSGLASGKSLFETFGNAVSNVLDKVLSKMEDAFVNNLFASDGLSGVGGVAGSAGGGIFDGIGTFFKSLFGFANGGSFQVGGVGGIDSQLVAFKASPNETVSVTKPGQSIGGSSGVVVNIINNNGSSVQQSQRQTAGGLELTVMIDEAVQKNLSTPGSGTRNAMEGQFGLKSGLARR